MINAVNVGSASMILQMKGRTSGKRAGTGTTIGLPGNRVMAAVRLKIVCGFGLSMEEDGITFIAGMVSATFAKHAQ